MNEQEAKNKWCPMTRMTPYGTTPAINREFNGDLLISATCLGSRCMMWRSEKDSQCYCALGGKPHD